MSKEYFQQFEWALPVAFADPVGACRFEEGDLLYNSRGAYQTTWGEAQGLLKHCIQIKSPARGPRAKVEQANESVFSDNWVQQVVLEMTEFPSQETRTITTTQGRLYSYLRFGDISQLEGASAEPQLPKLAQELMKDLESLAGKFVKKFDSKIQFVMPYDHTNPNLKAKRVNIEASLSSGLRFESVRHVLGDVDPELKDKFTATSELLCFKIKNGNLVEVNDALKRALYSPAKDKITDVDRFKLRKHGLLISP
jgi:hypothetical protein